jgi:tetratricopeptide (TPR) repeat protein
MSGPRRPTGVSPAQALDKALSLLPSNAALAERQANEVLRVLPDDARAIFIVGAARRRQGDLEGARRQLERLAGALPDWLPAQQELALALAGLGEHAGALATLRRVEALQRAAAQDWQRSVEPALLAETAAGGSVAEAAALVRAGLMREALPVLQRCLLEREDDLAAMRLLVDALLGLNQRQAAEIVLERAVALRPGDAELGHAYAYVLYQMGKPREALAQLEPLLSAGAADPKLHLLQTLCLLLDGDYQGAADLARAKSVEHPDQPQFAVCLGQTLRILGDAAGAAAAFRGALTVRPDLGEAWWCLADIRAEELTANDLARLRGYLADPALDAQARIFMHYALGRALENRKQWANSFMQYRDGARLQHGRIAYDADRNTAQTAASAAIASLAAGCEAGQPDGPVPVFIVGLPRSGSTLVEQILASHPEVEATAELPYMVLLAARLWQGGHEVPDLAQRRSLSAEYMALTARHRPLGRRFFCDKMPQNFHNIGLIRMILPQARIIDVRRHPMAAGFGNFKQLYSHGQDFSYALTDLGRYYRDYLMLMEHVDRVLPGCVHRVIYENLVDDTEGAARRMLDFCGLPFDPACLRHWEGGRPVPTYSAEQARRPVYRDALDHWRNYEAWLDPLKAALGSALYSWRGG